MLLLLLTALAPCAAPTGAPSPPPGPAAVQARDGAAGADEAARLDDVTISFAELEVALVDRYGNPAAERGQSALAHLARAALLRRLAEESRLVVTAEELDRRVDELARQTIESGEAQSLDDYLEQNGVTERAFRELLELSIVQERLSRKALGIPADREVAPELQERWLDEIIAQRGGLHYPPPPWAEGVVARLGDLAVGLDEYRTHLRRLLPAEDVRATCRHLLLVKLERARMPDLSDAAVERAVEAELARRQRLVAENPKFKGLRYEQLMAARGSLPGRVRHDPELVATALANVWVDRKYPEAELRRFYEDEREYFDGHYGEALDVSILYLTAAVLPNRLNPRSFEDAREEILDLCRGVEDLAGFQDVVVRHSDDPTTKAQKGALGWLTSSGERLDAIRAAVFSLHAGGLRPERRLVGPIDLPGGVALCWVEAWRPAPEWETMREQVRKELRRRFVDELCQEDAWTTYLDRL